MGNILNLPDLPVALKQYTGGKTMSYRRLYHRVLDGTLPASRSKVGRWVIKEEDLPQIAHALGLMPKAGHDQET